MVIGSFGDIIFEVSTEGRVVTPESVSRSSSAAYAEHTVVGAQPRIEFLSPTLSSINMHVILRADMQLSPEKEAERLRQYCHAGIHQRLIIAGKNFGDYVLESINETFLRGNAHGFLTISAELSFKEYY